MASAPKKILFDDFAEELLEERSVRPLIIVGASKVDDLLQEILSSYLLPKIDKDDELLGRDRPLNTFSARIKLCYRLGLIDKTLYTALEKLRALRNPSAHHITFDPSQPPVVDHLRDLRTKLSARASFGLTKERYFDDAILSPVEDLQCL